MFQNYIKTTIRIFKKQRLFLAINVLGLGIALGACFLLLLYAMNEFNYDRYHPNSERTYRILRYNLEKNEFDGKTSFQLAKSINANIPDSMVFSFMNSYALYKVISEFGYVLNQSHFQSN